MREAGLPRIHDRIVVVAMAEPAREDDVRAAGKAGRAGRRGVGRCAGYPESGEERNEEERAPHVA